MDKYIWIAITFIAGVILPLQAGINTKLGKAVSSPAMASLLSFMVGLLAMLVYIIVTQQSYSLKGLKDAPPHAWLGGILGAFYVTVIILAFPKIGPGLTFGLVVAGQLLLSIIMEHYQIMGAHHHPVSIGRVLGMLMIIGGVLVIKKM